MPFVSGDFTLLILRFPTEIARLFTIKSLSPCGFTNMQFYPGKAFFLWFFDSGFPRRSVTQYSIQISRVKQNDTIPLQVKLLFGNFLNRYNKCRNMQFNNTPYFLCVNAEVIMSDNIAKSLYAFPIDCTVFQFKLI